jgi:hypothetical protein
LTRLFRLIEIDDRADLVIKIVEVLGRSEQGHTKPFICRGEDENLYFVKGRGAGRRSQLCEWTTGHLARALGLPIAHFEVVDVPPILISSNLDLYELGAGPAFGSRKVANSAEFSNGDRGGVPVPIRRRILMFDWWVRNDDRTLTDKGGNPNLLWDIGREEIVMIDHNLAFNSAFDGPKFLDLLVFATEWDAMLYDLFEPQCEQQRFSGVLPTFDQACDNAPEEWWFEDDDGGVAANFDRTAIRRALKQCELSDFWKNGS